MPYSSTFLDIPRLFILILLTTGFDTDTYAFDSYTKVKRTMVSDTISETVLAEMARSDRKRSRMAMRFGIASIFTVFSPYPGSVGWFVFGWMELPVVLKIGGILGIISVALGVFSLVKRRTRKAFNTADNAKYIKLTKWTAIVGIILGVVSVLFMIFMSSPFIKNLLNPFI